MLKRGVVAFAVVSACVIDVSTVCAQPSQVAARLSYTREVGAETCPDGGALVAEVHLQLGYPVFEGDPVTRLVTASVRRVRDRFVARLALSSGSGEAQGSREIESRSANCDELAAALRLAISLALDPTPVVDLPVEVRVENPAPPPEAVARPPVQTPVPPPPARAIPTAPRVDRPLEWRAGAGAALGFGVLPVAAPVAVLSLSAQTERLAFVLEGAVYPQVSKSFGPTQLGVQAQLGRIGVCGWFVNGSAWGVATCGLATFGVLHGGSPMASDQSLSFIGAAGARLATRVRLLGPLAIEVRGDVHANLLRTELSFAEASLWKTPWLCGELALVGVVRFS